MNRLKYHCQKVLPLVYDDALSYYEVLGKLVEKINEIVEDINDNLKDYMIENWNYLFLDIAYIEETETIVLQLSSDDEDEE